MFYYIYETTNLINGKKYRGKHSSKKEKSSTYIGSGTILHKAIKKYGKENFICEILEYFNTDAEALIAERDVYVTEEWISRPDVYNLMPGGYGGQSGYIPAKNKYGDNLVVSKDDCRWKTGELVGITAGLALVKFANDTTKSKAFWVDKNDERIKHGILVGHTKNTTWNENRVQKYKEKKVEQDTIKYMKKLQLKEEEARLKKIKETIAAEQKEIQKAINKIKYIEKVTGKGNSNYKKKWMYLNENIESFVKAENQQAFIQDGWKFGRCKLSILKQKAGYTEEARNKMGTLKGTKLSEETKKKIGEKSKGRKWTDAHYIACANRSHESFASIKNKICINNNKNNKYIYLEELSKYIDNGWFKGMLRRS